MSCGARIFFDEQIDTLLLEQLRREGRILGSDHLILEERTALEHWNTGHAR